MNPSPMPDLLKRLPLLFACAGALSACTPPGGASAAAAADAASALTVQLTSLQRGTLPELVQGSGSVTAWQEAVISTEIGSYRIAELLVDVGAIVRKGQPMAQLASASLEADLRKQEAALAEAVAALKQAAADAKRARSVVDSGALSPQKVDEYLVAEESKQAAVDSARADLEATRLQLSQTRIVAVDDGVVSSRTAVLGNVVAAGTELFRLVRHGRVEWRLELDARQLARVRPGEAAQVLLPDGRSEAGTVRLVAPTLSSSTGRGLVYVSLPEDSSAQAGSYASGAIRTGGSDGWTLPENALVASDGRAYVYTVDARRQAHRVAVETGRRRDGRVEILHGLPLDARVVASGGSFLSEGAHVSVAAASQAAGAQR
jgi:RND family efflux transporter MFP subunit